MSARGSFETGEAAAAASARKKRRIRISLASLVAVVSLATGILTLKDQLFPSDDKAPPVVVVPKQQSGPVARFDGIAGHLAESRALLDFLDQHDDDVVYLEVGFPKLSPAGPVSGDNVVAKTVATETGDLSQIASISLMTTCPPEAAGEENPTPQDGCMGSELMIGKPETRDSYTYFEHGVPAIKGYFKVDVTGGLHQGLSPIFLKPLTFAQATGR